MRSKKFLKYLLFCSLCFILRNFELIVQFNFYLYAGNNIGKFILNKSCNCWYNKFSIKLMMVFFICVLVHVWLPFNFAILNEFDLLWYSLYTYHWRTHYSWINVWFKHWTWYSSKCVMCNVLLLDNIHQIIFSSKNLSNNQITTTR